MTSSAAPRRRLLPALLATVALAASAILATAVPASAHDELVSSDPAAGATLDAVPAEITLTYSAEILAEDGATQVQVTDESGASLTETGPVVSGTEVTQALSPEASGVVSVVWRVVSSDGHPISGDFTFTVPAAAPTPSETASSTPSSTPSSSPSATAEQTATPDATAPAAEQTSDASPLPWILLVVVLLIVAGAIAYLFVARGRRGAGDGGSTGTPGR